MCRNVPGREVARHLTWGGNVRKIMREIGLVGTFSRVNRNDGRGQWLRPFWKCSKELCYWAHHSTEPQEFVCRLSLRNSGLVPCCGEILYMNFILGLWGKNKSKEDWSWEPRWEAMWRGGGGGLLRQDGSLETDKVVGLRYRWFPEVISASEPSKSATSNFSLVLRRLAKKLKEHSVIQPTLST